jgi:hypothetical protein
VEFTTYGGHATGFGATLPVEWRLGHDGQPRQAGLDAAIDAFAAQGALFSINHPALDIGELCIGCAWEHDAPEVGRLHAVEIETGGYRQAGFLFFDDALFFWEALLDAGHHLAALGGSDDHQAGTSDGSPIGDPTTLVYTEELSVEGLRRGILESRTVVKLQGPDDPMIALDGDGTRDGDTMVGPGGVTVSARVTGGAGLQLWWVIDGAYQDVQDIGSDDATFTREIALQPGEVVRVRAQVDDGDTPRTLTSYLWIGGVARDHVEGCGCTAGDARASAPATALALITCAITLGTRRRSSAAR